MAIKQRLRVVNFGGSQGGLTTVGYTVYKTDGTVKTSRSTSGVVEFGTNTGCYGANIPIEDSENLTVLWDTGTGSPKYTVDESGDTLGHIQDETDHIRMIWNSMRNQGELYTKILEIVKGIKSPADKSQEIEKILKKVDELPSISDIKSVQINIPQSSIKVPAPIVNLPAPIVNIPKQNVPDYSSKFLDVNKMIIELRSEIRSMPSMMKEANAELSLISGKISSLMGMIPEETKGILGEIISDVKSLNERMSESENILTSIGNNIEIVKETTPSKGLVLGLCDMMTKMIEKLDQEKKKIKVGLGIK